MFDLPSPDDENTGKHLTDVAKALIRDDNKKKYRMALAKEISEGGDIKNIRKEEAQMNKNTFCMRSVVLGTDNCGTTRRNSDKLTPILVNHPF